MKPDRIARMLPLVYRRTLADSAVLNGLIGVMDELHQPIEEQLDCIDEIFNPRRAPDRFVPVLAQWVDLHLPVTSGMGRLRELIATAALLSQWRGTARGLRLFLETATGATGFEIVDAPDVDGTPLPFQFVVRAPSETEPHRAMLERIIEMEKPAHVTYALIFEPAKPPRGVQEKPAASHS